MLRKATLLLLLGAAVLLACGDPEETCTCACTCGSGEKSTIQGASSKAECANSCETHCGADSFSSSYDCKTKGAITETAPAR